MADTVENRDSNTGGHGMEYGRSLIFDKEFASLYNPVFDSLGKLKSLQCLGI